MRSFRVLVGNDNVLTVDELKNDVSGEYINGAVVTVTLVDSDGNNVAGDTWPKTLPYVAASNGKYRATLKDTLSLTHNSEYMAKVAADAGTDLQGYWELELVARTRTS